MADPLRGILGGVPAGDVDTCYTDNVAIALCTYFDDHPLKPEEEEGEHGWTPWVVEQVNATLDAMADAARNAMKHEVPRG